MKNFTLCLAMLFAFLVFQSPAFAVDIPNCLFGCDEGSGDATPAPSTPFDTITTSAGNIFDSHQDFEHVTNPIGDHGLGTIGNGTQYLQFEGVGDSEALVTFSGTFAQYENFTEVQTTALSDIQQSVQAMMRFQADATSGPDTLYIDGGVNAQRNYSISNQIAERSTISDMSGSLCFTAGLEGQVVGLKAEMLQSSAYALEVETGWQTGIGSLSINYGEPFTTTPVN